MSKRSVEDDEDLGALDGGEEVDTGRSYPYGKRVRSQACKEQRCVVASCGKSSKQHELSFKPFPRNDINR